MKKNGITNKKLDDSQAKVIGSDEQYIVVEAPAGYGKTSTMISLIEHWISSGQIKNFQHIICMSFSNSAANRMKEGIEQDFKFKNFSNYSLERVISTNFHGLCRKILKKYGYLVNLNDLESLTAVDAIRKGTAFLKNESESKTIKEMENGISKATLKEKDLTYLIPEYNKIILKYFVNKGFISYTSIITFTLQLLKKYGGIKDFYNKYFYAICIDEYQDTNILELSLIELILGEKTRFVGFGDSIQQIYGFQGAIPDLMEKDLPGRKTSHLELKNNYRFQSNRNMIILDKNLREFYKDQSKNFSNEADIYYIKGKDKKDEGAKILSLIKNFKSKDAEATFAILVPKKKDKNNEEIFNTIKQEEDIFNALFSNDDEEFMKFQDQVAEIYKNNFTSLSINSKNICKFIRNVSKKIDENAYTNSFLSLLEAFLKNCISKYGNNYRNEIIVSTLSTYSLRQSIKDVKEKIFISTIHGAKGLEWDYVIIANFEKNEIPNYYDIKDKDFKNVMRKFYVAFTRAKKKIFISYSNKSWINSEREVTSEISCLTKLPFLNLINYQGINEKN